jgi:hypothetical protein
MISTPDEFKRLRESTDPEQYARAASESAPLEVWRELVARMPEMHFWVAQNKTVPIEILGDLAQCSDVTTRSMVARKGKITESIGLTLAEDTDESVRAALARNTKLPKSVRDVLQADPSPLVQEALATHQQNG